MLSKLNSLLSEFFLPTNDADHPAHTLQLATAVLLIEVMRSDAESTEEEQATVLKILKERFQLSDEQVAQLSERGQQTAKDANDFYQFTSLINKELVMSEKIPLIEYMWQVAYADGKISPHEEHILRKIAGLLYVSHANYITAKMRAKAERLKQ